jgi:hypothetical protein
MSRGFAVLRFDGRNHIQRGRNTFSSRTEFIYVRDYITLLELEIFNVTIFGAKVSIKNLMFNFPHFEREILVDTTFAHIKVQELEITQWTLPEDHQI